jgi:type IV pilus assembly protein PilV
MSSLPCITSKCALGFTLIEVLVAVVILSVGVLGLAHLQIKVLRSLSGSYLQQQAVTQAYDLADRMRANKAGFEAGSYNSADSVNYQIPANNGCTQSASAALNCTSAQMAAHDSFEWAQNLDRALPKALGTVCLDQVTSDATACDGAGTTYTITVAWTDRSDQRNYSIRFQD